MASKPLPVTGVNSVQTAISTCGRLESRTALPCRWDMWGRNESKDHNCRLDLGVDISFVRCRRCTTPEYSNHTGGAKQGPVRRHAPGGRKEIPGQLQSLPLSASEISAPH